MLNTYEQDFTWKLRFEVVLMFYFQNLDALCVIEYSKYGKDLEGLEESLSLAFLLAHSQLRFQILLIPHKLPVEDPFRPMGKFFRTHPDAHLSMLSFPLRLKPFLVPFPQESVCLSSPSTFFDSLPQFSP